MALDPVTAGIDLVSTIVSRIFPDKTEEEKAQLSATLAVVQGQLSINQAEAANTSVFVSGWRPFIGWVCGLACAWNWIGIPIANLLITIARVHFEFPDFALSQADTSEMMPILMGMLGLGGLRTVEKIQGVAAK